MRATADILEAALLGGVVLSAGGSGIASIERNRKLGALALAYGPVEIAPLDRFADDDGILVATGVGAPGFNQAKNQPRDSVEAARMVVEAAGRAPAAVMPGHVPGIYAWLQAAVLGIPLVDAACNGRGHPTVKMGALGLAGEPATTIVQAGVGGDPDAGTTLKVLVVGNAVQTSNVMRQAAIQNGGLLYAARGPFPARFVRERGAAGAIGYQIGLGEAMRDAAGRDRLDAVLAFTKGRVIGEGRVVGNDVTLKGGFDVGQVDIDTAGGPLSLGVYNEYMTAELSGRRIATFPDLLFALDAGSGDGVAISESRPGREVVAIAVSKRLFPIGAGARDPAAYPDVEAGMGMALARYALDPEA